MSLNTKRVISIVDDDESCREAIAGLMNWLGFEVQTFASAVEFLASPDAVGQSLLYKLGVRAYAKFLIRRRLRDFMRPGSEALEVTRAIFWQMDDDQRQDGGRFILVFLPLGSELKRLASNTSYRSQWRAMVDSMCGRPLACIDLGSYLPARPASDIDRGYDGTPYGPVANRRIGEFMARELMHPQVLEGATGKAGEFRQ